MSYALAYTPAFTRAARRLARKRPDAKDAFVLALEQLAADPYHPSLRTHKLQGALRGTWAFSGGYDLRILFRFAKVDGHKGIVLLSMGTHDEVY